MWMLLGATALAHPLTLTEFLEAFAETDPVLSATDFEIAAAASQIDAASHAERTEWFASPTVRGGVFGSGSEWSPFGAGAEASAGVTSTGPKGRSATGAVYGNARIPSVFSGPSVGGLVQGRMPLLDNAGGKLIEARVDAARAGSEAVKATAARIRLDRCLQGAEAFVVAANLEAQADAYEEFLTAKRDYVAQTEKDVKRGMVLPLELLTAQSDLNATVGEQLALEQSKAEALASLSTWTTSPPTALALPDLSAWSLETDVQHPAAQEFAGAAAARRAEAAALKRANLGQIDLLPQGGVEHQSLALATDGSAIGLTEASVGLGLEVRIPTRQPAVEYQLTAAEAEAKALEARVGEAERVLSEAQLRAQANLAGVVARTKNNQERLTIIEEQIDTAWESYLAGKIEYQDFAQHYQGYAATKLGAVRLDLERQLATLSLAQAAGHLPQECAP